MWKDLVTAFNQHNEKGLLDLIFRTLALNPSFEQVRK